MIRLSTSRNTVYFISRQDVFCNHKYCMTQFRQYSGHTGLLQKVKTKIICVTPRDLDAVLPFHVTISHPYLGILIDRLSSNNGGIVIAATRLIITITRSTHFTRYCIWTRPTTLPLARIARLPTLFVIISPFVMFACPHHSPEVLATLPVTTTPLVTSSRPPMQLDANFARNKFVFEMFTCSSA